MTELEQSAFFADLEAALAALDNPVSANCQRLMDELMTIGSPTPLDDRRPDFVAAGGSSDAGNAEGNKVCDSVDEEVHQYADTHAPQLTDTSRPTEQFDAVPDRTQWQRYRGNRKRPAWRIAADRFASAPCPAGLTLRQPRRRASRIDVVAGHKTWDGTKSKKRRDRLSPAEKFSASVWAAAGAKGAAVSLNLGVARENMLRHHADPKRRMTQNLSKHLAAAGLGDIPYAFVFELTPAKDGGRLHLHGVMDTSGLSAMQNHHLQQALIKAASEATGAIGGKRQLDVAPLYNPVGWTDYLLDDTPRTKRELGLTDPFMISKSMRRLAKTHFELLQLEVLRVPHAAFQELASTDKIEPKPQQIGRRGFTLRSTCDRNRLSGERDKTSAGGAQRKAHHRPNGRRSGWVKSTRTAVNLSAVA